MKTNTYMNFAKRLVMVLAVGLMAVNMWGTDELYATITPLTTETENDGTASFSKNTTVSDALTSSPASIVSNFSEASYVYKAKSGSGWKFGSGSYDGNITLTLSSTIENVTKIVVNAKKYASNKSTTLNCNGLGAETLTNSFENYEFEYTNPTNVSSINLVSTRPTSSDDRRCYVTSIEIYVTPSGDAITLHKNNNDATGSTAGAGTIAADATTMTIGTAPTRTGYSVEGYYTDAECTLANKIATAAGALQPSITVDAKQWTDGDSKWKKGGAATFFTKWTAKEYSVTLNGNGATTAGSSNVTLIYNSASHVAITNPKKTHYIFNGWYSGEGGTGSLVIATDGTLQANVSGYTGAGGIWTRDEASTTLYAKWTEHTYTNYRTKCCTPLDAPENIEVSVTGAETATVTWDAVTDATGYEYSFDGETWTSASSPLNLTGLTSATGYSIYLRTNGSGDNCTAGEASAGTNFTTYSTITAASNDALMGTAKVSLNGTDWYDAVEAEDGTTIYLQATAASALYEFSNWATPASGSISSNQLTSWEGDVTVTANFQTQSLTELDVPTGMGLVGTAGAISATIKWNAVDHASSYLVTCADATIGDVTVTDGVASCTLTGLSANTEYTWNVQAIGDGVSYKSGSACADQAFTTDKKKPVSISITTPPTKTTYVEGETFDATGMVVSVSYNTGESDAVYTITPSSALEFGTTAVTLTASLNNAEVTTTQAITVLKKYVLTFKNNGSEVSHVDLYEGAAYGTLPTLTSGNCDATSSTFMGWTTEEIGIKTNTAPTYAKSTDVMPADNVVLNAVWAKQTGHEGYDLVTSPTSGKTYIFVSGNSAGSAYALHAKDMNTSTNSGAHSPAKGVTISSGSPVYVGTVDEELEFVFSSNKYSIVSRTGYYFYINGNGVSRRDDAQGTWDADNGLYATSSSGKTTYYLSLDTSGETPDYYYATSSASANRVYAFEKQEISYGEYITHCISSAVTIATLTNGSTITVKNGDDAVASGDAFAPGVELTITTNAADGYRVDNLHAYKTGDEITAVTITNGKLTMPAYPITITAEETAVYPVAVAVKTGQSTWGSVTINGAAGPAYVNEDDDPAIVATPNAGYEFVEWTVTTSGTYDLGDKALTDASINPMVSAAATFTATFAEKAMTGLTLSSNAMSVDLANGTTSLSVTGYTPSDLLDAKKTVNWSSSDETVATVDGGTITLLKAGTTTITTAWTEDESVNATCALTVYQWNFTGYTVTTAPKIAYYTIEKFSTAGVVIKENYERSDDSSTKQETYSGAWTAKLNDEAIEDGDDLTAGEYTLKLYIGEEEIASYTMTVEDVPVDLFEVGIWDIDAPIFQTGTYTMPSLSNQTAGAAATCKDHNLFVGWTTDPDDPNKNNITAGGTEGIVASNTTYYAVWAKNGTITDDVEKNSFVEADKNGATLNAGISYTTAQNGATKGAEIYEALRLYQKSGGGYGGYILFTASTGYTITAIELTTSTGSKFGYGPDKDHLTQGTISNGKVTLTNLSVSAMCIATSSESGSTSDRLNISAISVHYQTTGPTDYITDCETRYTIEFYADQTLDDKVAEKKYKDGTVIEMPDKYIGMSKEYHTFAGWRSAAEYTESIDKVYAVGEEYTVAGDDYIYGEWTPFSQGTVTVDGETLEGSPFYATQSYTLPTPEAISGKRFIGWSDGENIVAPGEYAMPDPAVPINYTSQWFDLLPKPSGVSFTDGEWILVTAQDQLHAGDFVVVAAANADYAMGANAGNNCARESVTKSGNTLSYESGVHPLFLQNGYGANQYALYDMIAEKYLYAASSSNNYLRTADDFDLNGSWLITIADGNTSVIAQGSNTHNNLQYTEPSGVANSVFSCYSGAQKPIAIYKWIQTIRTEGHVDASDVMPTYNVNLVVQTNTSIDMNVERTVNDFIIEAMEGESGQITHPEKLNINGNAYYDLTLNTSGTMDNSLWYAFAVPFQVDAATGIQRLSNDGVASPAQFNGHYVLLKYNSAAYASAGEGWEYMTAGETLMPGKFYMIALNSNAYNRVRMTKKAGAALNNKADLTLSLVGEGIHANWNALANNALAYVQVNAAGGNSGLKVQTYNSADNNYTAFDFNKVTLTVGTPFFIQAAVNNDPLIVSVATSTENTTVKAPQREAVATEEFQIRLGENTESYYDILYVSASEEALNEYQIGHDLAKAGVSKTVPQMYVPAYGAKLCDAEFPLENNEATFPLTFTAPNAGTYQLYVAEAAQDAELYLLQNNRIIWNLTLSPYEIALPQGTTEGYSLLLKAKAPSVVTGVEQIDAKAGVQKVIIDEHVYILRGGQMYDVNGKMVK